MNYTKIIVASIAILGLLSCHRLPDATDLKFQKIEIGYGPEDLLLDISNNQRLLVSCDPRRENQKDIKGDIYSLDIANDSTKVISRIDEPEGFIFHPHGIDEATIDSTVYLYVINHRDDINLQQVVKYSVMGDTLKFEKLYNHELYISPNDICADEVGGFWITNDASKRHCFKERLFRLKNSNIVYTNINSESKVVADKLAYANGITRNESKLYVSTTLQDKIFVYDIGNNGSLTNREVVCKLYGGDNITISENNLIIAAHLNVLAFQIYASKESYKSPSTVYSVNPDNGNSKVLYANDGGIISGSSTGLIIDDYLYIGQVFEPFLLKVSLK